MIVEFFVLMIWSSASTLNLHPVKVGTYRTEERCEQAAKKWVNKPYACFRVDAVDLVTILR